MGKAVVAGLAAVGALLLLRHRRRGPRAHVDLYYEDGSIVTLEHGAPGSERLLALAHSALGAARG